MKIAIIGAGAVGMGVANKLARENANLKIHVFQEKNYISLGACGIPYFIANDFKKADLLNARTTKDFKNKNFKSIIQFHLKTIVSDLDPAKKTISYHKITNKNDKKVMKFDYLVIATGANAKIMPPYNEYKTVENVFTVNTKEDAINIKKSIINLKRHDKANNLKVAIIGGSYIGLEIAESCLKLKTDVTIFEAENRLMKKVVDEEFSNLIYDEITGKSLVNEKNSHAKVVLNCKTEQLIVKNNKITAIKTNQTTNNLFACDLVILATGVIPNTFFLNNTNIKLERNNAIITNKYGQVLTRDNKQTANSSTNHYDNIFAAGDCATVTNQSDQSQQYIPLATTANKIARLIAHNIISNNKQSFPGTLGSSIIRINNLEIANSGIKNQSWNENNIASVYVESYDLPRYMIDSRPLYLKLFYDKNNFQLLAAQMAGYNHATLRINALATAIWNKMDIRDLQYLDLVYAPPFARTVDIIHLASRQVKKG